jgi:hypothetical protein
MSKTQKKFNLYFSKKVQFVRTYILGGLGHTLYIICYVNNKSNYYEVK